MSTFLDLRSRKKLKNMTIAVAYSGGPDAAALAARLQAAGATVMPVYVQYRNRGGKTAKDLRAAALSVHRLGLSTNWIYNPLVHRITGDEKSRRNRIILEALSNNFVDSLVSAIAIGTFKENDEDLDPQVLAQAVEANGHQLITWDSYGVTDKADEFRGLSAAATQAIFATTSCQMWWKIECGNCYSCLERHKAFLTAFGQDPTVYRPNSTVMKSAL